MSLDLMNKQEICSFLLELSEKNKLEAIRMQKEAQERANEAEGTMVSRYDTFKEEGQYLSDALKIRCLEAIEVVERIKEVIRYNSFEEMKRVAILSFVTVELKNGTKKVFFLFPSMPGQIIGEITVITTSSPLGQALLNKEEGDEFKFIIAGRITEGTIVEVK